MAKELHSKRPGQGKHGETITIPFDGRKVEMHNAIIASILFLLLFAADRAWSGEILQPRSCGSFNIFVYSPVGQTFTAEDPQISTIGFYLSRSYGPTTSISYTLLEDVGLSGTILASRSFTVSGFTYGFFDADFSSVSLSVGQVYTVLVSASNPYVTIDYNTRLGTQSDYVGGDEIREGQLMEGSDLTFRIELIPEPSSTTLFLRVGAAGLIAHVVRRSKRAGLTRALQATATALADLTMR